GLRAVPSETLRFALGYFTAKPDGSVADSTATADVDYRIDEKWGIEAFERYDLRHGVAQDNRLVIKNFWHDFVVEISLGYDAGADDASFSIGITPRQLYKNRGLRGFHAGDQPEFDQFDSQY